MHHVSMFCAFATQKAGLPFVQGQRNLATSAPKGSWWLVDENVFRKWRRCVPRCSFPTVGFLLMNLSRVSSVREFEYEWSDGYTLSQDLFQQAVLTGNPQALIDLWHSQPSHIDTMLQLAEYFRTVGQKDACADFVQRCLYVLESGWHVAFKPWETHCRLSYGCIPNRAFFLTLFRHMQLIGRAGCSRTATEIGKLLLHVAPSTDPMRALLCVGMAVLSF